MGFKSENATRGVNPDVPYQTGINDVDAGGGTVERGYKFPANLDAQATWVYYQCALVPYLDSGIAVHRVLPQYDADPPATLGSFDLAQKGADKIVGMGVNLKNVERFQDVVQRMAHAVWIFNLRGVAGRVGQEVPIPMLKTVGGVPAIPYDEIPQVAYNEIVGNFSGAVLYRAEWSLWYTVVVPPIENQDPPANPSAHVDATVDMPNGIQVPFSLPDDNSVPASPPQTNPQVSGEPFRTKG